MQIQKIQLQFNNKIQRSCQKSLRNYFQVFSDYFYDLSNNLKKYFYLLVIAVIIVVFDDFGC